MNAKMTTTLVAGLATLALAPTLALAQGTSSASASVDARPTHSTGLMLRYTVGASYARTGQKFDTIGDPKYHVHGPALDMSLAGGVALSQSFALHATALFWRTFNPKAKGEFGGISSSTDITGTELTNFGIGGGMTFWSRSNVYFSLSAVASMLRVEVEDYRQDTKWGIGGEVLIGKEWWLGQNFGMGFAAAGTIHYIPDGNNDDAASGLLGFSVGPRLTMTFN